MTAGPRGFASGSTSPFDRDSEHSSVFCPVMTCLPFGHTISQTRPDQDHGSLHSSSFPAPTTVQVSFVYAERKEEMRRLCSQTGCARSKAWVFLFMFLGGYGERERKSRRDLGKSDCHFYFVCARFYLIDGLHIPIVTSLRRLSTVGCGGVGVIVSRTRTGRVSPGSQGERRIVQTLLLGTTITTWQDRPDILGSQRCLREY